MKRTLIFLAAFLLLAGCATPQQAATPAPSVQATPATAPAPARPPERPEPPGVIDGDTVRLPEEVTMKVPPGMDSMGTTTLVLKGVDPEIANITFLECPLAPEAGCLPNHRGPTATGPVVVAGQPAERIDAEFEAPAAANDQRVWLEWHTFFPLPSGRRVDIVGQVLKGSGKETALRSAYDALLSSLVRK